MWDTTLVHPSAIPEGHSKQVTSVAFSKDGSRVVSGSCDHTARIWDTTTGLCVARLEGHVDRVRCVAFHPDGSRLATGSDDKTIRLWNADTGDCIVALKGHALPITSLAFSTNGTYLRSKDGCDEIRFWDTSRAEQVEKSDDGQPGKQVQDPFKIDDRRLTRIYEDGAQHLVCILPPSMSDSKIASAELVEGGHRVALGCTDGALFVLDISLPSSG